MTFFTILSFFWLKKINTFLWYLRKLYKILTCLNFINNLLVGFYPAPHRDALSYEYDFSQSINSDPE